MAIVSLNYVKNLLKKAKTARQLHEDEISEAYLYTFPNRDIWRSYEGTTDRQKLYDMTAVDSVQNLVSTILNLLIPQNQQWAYIDVRQEVKNKMAPDVRRMLDTANKTVFKILRDSNFYVAASEALQDCVISGTGAICIMDPMDGKGMNFMAIPTSQLYFLSNYKDDVDVVFRESEQSAQYIFERWGSQAPELKDEADKHPDKKHKLLEAVFRKTGEEDYCYHVYVGKEMKLVESSMMPVNPFVVFRFSKTLGEHWGESPVRSALPHIRTANEIQKMMLQSGAWSAMGAFQVSSDTTVNFSNMKLQPGEVITVDQPLQPVPFPGNFNISEAMMMQHQDSIRRMLFNDAIMPAGAPNTYQTATEVSARQAQFYQRIGPFGLRLESEFLRPLIKTLVTKLQRRGMVPEFVINTSAFELVVNSAVKKGIAMTEIQRDMQLLQMVQALGPDAMMLVDMKKLAKKILTDGDMSPDIIRTEREIAQMQEQMQQQMAQNQLMQGAQQLLNANEPQSQGDEPTQG
tara:strand:+ start:3952 stop:5502 length:1551 start_codon:yes stop_codon:yes gene_type:complete